VSQRNNGYFARNGRLQRIKCAPARAEDRARTGGTPDSLQDLSGAPPESPAGPQDRAPTVGTQRPSDVAGAPDSVRWRTGLSGAPYDRNFHQRPYWWLGLQKPPTTTLQCIQVSAICIQYKSSRLHSKTQTKRSNPLLSPKFIPIK
jgi:hypothetical protein